MSRIGEHGNLTTKEPKMPEPEPNPHVALNNARNLPRQEPSAMPKRAALPDVGLHRLVRDAALHRPPKRVKCKECNGSGQRIIHALTVRKCLACDGRGRVVERSIPNG